MKILLRTDFCSNEFWNDANYALVTISPEQLKAILKLKEDFHRFFKHAKKTVDDAFGYGHLRISSPASITFFKDNDENTIDQLMGEDKFKEPAQYKVVDDNWELPPGCDTARTECHMIQIDNNHHQLWIIANSKDSADYLETALPNLLLKRGKIILAE